MNYDEIQSTSYGYADRQDSETIDMYDNFLRVVEARVNKLLQVQKQSMRTKLLTVKDQEYYGLPDDFGGLRDIEVSDLSGETRNTLQYLNPEQMNDAASVSQLYRTTDKKNFSGFYTIIANQLQIFPPQDGLVLEIIYYQNINPLTEENDVNWLSNNNPDCYIFGVLTEINAFVKDSGSTSLWNERFTNAINEITKHDKDSRWSGTALTVKIG